MSIRLCKIFFNQKIFGVFGELDKKSCHVNSFKLMSRICREKCTQVSQDISDFITKETQICRNILMNETSLPVQWKFLEENLNLLESANVRSTIFKSCNILKRGDLALDYCQYLLNKGEKLSLIETSLFIKTLAKCETNVQNHDKLLKTIYNHSHDTIFAIEITVKEAVKIFSNNKHCFKEICTKYDKGELNNAGIGALISGAFGVNEPELAWKIANENPAHMSSLGFSSYLRFCIRSAEQNKFSLGMIDDIITFSKTHTTIFKCDRFFEYINELVSALNKTQTEEYLWSVDKCFVDNLQSCSSCRYKFQRETITEEELKVLKKNFLKKVMVSSNINMKTTPEELKEFLIFLENSKPYDVVVDGLNLTFRSSQKRKSKPRMEILSLLQKQRMRILCIGRNHFKNRPEYNGIKESCQIFLTRNDSMDDLFCLYAAMNRGLNTYFCTSDFLRDHAKFFADDFNLINLFRKWQISHQCLLSINTSKMLYPRFHSDIPQSSVVVDESNNVEEYRWHLSYIGDFQNYRLENPAQWVCLRAKSKARRRKKTE